MIDGMISPVNSERQGWAAMSSAHSTHHLMTVSILCIPLEARGRTIIRAYQEIIEKLAEHQNIRVVITRNV